MIDDFEFREPCSSTFYAILMFLFFYCRVRSLHFTVNFLWSTPLRTDLKMRDCLALECAHMEPDCTALGSVCYTTSQTAGRTDFNSGIGMALNYPLSECPQCLNKSPLEQ